MVGLLIGIARLSATRIPMLGRFAARFGTSRAPVSMPRIASTARWAIVAILTALFVFHSFAGNAAHAGSGEPPTHIHLTAVDNGDAHENSASTEGPHHLAPEDHSHSFLLAAQSAATSLAAGHDSRWPVRQDSLLAALRYELKRPPRPLAQG